MLDPRLVSLLGDKRFRCFVNLLKGRGCDMLNIDQERLLSGDRDEVEKVYKFLPELESVRRQGYDIVGRLVELANKLRSEKVSDMAVAMGVMMSVMFGREVSEEDARKIGTIIDVFDCITFYDDRLVVHNECLDKIDVPEDLKNYVRMVGLANLVWSM